MEKVEERDPTTDRRKPRRSRPELGALSSLVSFDRPEAEDFKHEQKTERRNESLMTVSKPATQSHGNGHDFTRISSAPTRPSTLVSRGAPSIRKTLSQDWLKTGFSPRPGKEPRKEFLWGGDCVRPAQRLLSNIQSLCSIPEEDELDRDEGSDLSDDNVLPEGASQPKSSSAGKLMVDERGAADAEAAPESHDKLNAS